MNGEKRRYVRKLSAIERYNLAINEITRYNVDAVLEGTGELDVERWRYAVAVAAEANPGVRVRLKSFLGFSKWVDSGIAPTVEVISAPDWDGYSDVGTDFLRDRFDVLNGDPVADIKLIPGDPARVVFRGLHAAMDARGFNHFGTDVFRVLQGKPPIGSRDTITDLDIRLMHQDKVKAQPTEPLTCIPALAPPPTPEEGSLRFVWRRVQLPRIIANRLPKMAIYLAQRARQLKEGDVAFTIPVDFRALRHQVNSTANLTGYIQVPVQPGDTPDDFLKGLTQQIEDYADCVNPDSMKKLPWTPISTLKKSLAARAPYLLYTENAATPTAGIVNLGHFDPSLWSFSGFEARRGFGIPGAAGKMNVLLHTYRDGTEVVFSVPEGYNLNGQLDALIEDFKTSFV